MRARLICVEFFGRRNSSVVDKGFAPNEPVDVVIRPEDIDIVHPPNRAACCGTVTTVTFKGVHYDTIVDLGRLQSGSFRPPTSTQSAPIVGIRLEPDAIHVMHKSEYSGQSTATTAPTPRNTTSSPMQPEGDEDED